MKRSQETRAAMSLARHEWWQRRKAQDRLVKKIMLPIRLIHKVLTLGLIGGLAAILLVPGGAGGCGGVGFDNPPNVAGTYECISGCNGTCTFGTTMVQQTGNQILVDSSPNGDIDNDGNFSFSDETVSCTGQFIDNTAIADCIVDGTDCQRVTYARD